MAKSRKKQAAATVETTSAPETTTMSAAAEPSVATASATEATESMEEGAAPSGPFSIAHNHAAGIQLLKHGRFKQVQLRFSNAVPQGIEEDLKAHGWRFRPEEGVYTRQYGTEGEGAAVVRARREYGELCQVLAPEAQRSR